MLQADNDDFGVEALGILGNLTIPDLDYELIINEYELIPWIKKRLEPGKIYTIDYMYEIEKQHFLVIFL
jgi:hypothetical protein